MTILRQLRHSAHLLTVSSREMKSLRIIAPRFIFQQHQKAGQLQNQNLNPGHVDLSDISDGVEYYAGFKLILELTKSIFKNGRTTAGSDAAHWKGTTGTKKLGTTFAVLNYDTNKNICSIFFQLLRRERVK